MKSIVSKYGRQLTMPLLLVVIFIVSAVLTNGSITRSQNISNLLLQNAYVIIMACGMLLCILTGGHIDLSVGSTLCLSAALCAELLTGGCSVAIAILISLGVSIAIGAIQGFLIGYKKIPPFICTLAGMFVIRGIARVVTESKTIIITNEDFFNVFGSYIQIPGIDHDGYYLSALLFGIILSAIIIISLIVMKSKRMKKGTSTSGWTATIIGSIVVAVILIGYCSMLAQYKGIPVMFLWILVIVGFFLFFLNRTIYGRYYYAVGSNKKAAELSGIKSKKVMFWAYLIMSLLAGFSGLLMATRIGSVDGNMGSGYEMDAIAACFIGGASAYGGRGTVQGVVIGALFLGVINMAMSIMGLPDQWQYIVKGLVLIIAVLFDVSASKRTARINSK